MRILIVGSDANAYSIAENMKKNSAIDVVFAVSNNKKIFNIAENVDIVETNNDELLDFVIANEINLTIVTSIKAIYNGIADCFNQAEQLVFAPSFESAVPVLYRSAAKKTMYKLKIPTMKFGVFERENQAIDYVSKERRTLLIKNDSHMLETIPKVTYSFKEAKAAIEEGFSYPNNKIIIEDYVDADKISIYYITDGYSAIPIGSCSYDGEYVISPNKFCNEDFEYKIRDCVVIPLLDEIAEKGNSYCGIIGVDLLVNNDIFNVIEFYPFFKNIDCQTILPRIKDNIYDIFVAAAIGSLSDEYERINTGNEMYIAALVKDIDDNKVDYLFNENLKLAYSYNNKEAVLSEKANTISKGRMQLKEDIDFIKGRDD